MKKIIILIAIGMLVLSGLLGLGSRTHNATAATPTVTLVATPNTGSPPLRNVSLTVTISNWYQAIYLYFWCDGFDASPDKFVFLRPVAPGPITYTARNLCNYNSAGTYHPLVWGLYVGYPGNFEVSTTVTVSSCTPLPPQTRTLDCPAGQTGAITQRRTSSCPGPTWSDWTTISSTCAAGPTTNITFIQDTRDSSIWPPGFRDFRSLSSTSD